VNSARPRSKRARTVNEVGPVAGYYEEDASSIRAGDVWRMGPGLWAPKRAGEEAHKGPGPEGILAKGRAGALVKWCACSLKKTKRLSRRGGPGQPRLHARVVREARS
jgi:hypothetical protein